MEPRKGYYGLIQFCPDRARAELVNIGVVLFVPETLYLRAVTVKTARRIQSVFGRGAVDAWWLKSVRESFERRLVIEHKERRFARTEDLEKYFGTLGNDVIVSALRPTRVEDPKESMSRLFAQLVSDDPKKAEYMISRSVQPLEDTYMRLKARMIDVRTNQKYSVPGIPHAVMADYVFPNGKANLVRLLRFGPQPGHVFDQAMKLGGESVFVDKHLVVEGRKAARIVVAAPTKNDAESKNVEEQLARVFKDFPAATFVPTDKIGEFAQHIEESAD